MSGDNPVSLSALTISNGRTETNTVSGGGIYNETGRLTLSSSIVNHNAATVETFMSCGNGGGIYNQGVLTLTNSTVTSKKPP
jgi:hypothetical protein